MTSVIACADCGINNNYIKLAPGGVAPVGDVLVMERRMRSMPEQAPLILTNPSWGSNAVDGNNQSMYRVSSGARVYDDFNDPRPKILNVGVELKDVKPVDRQKIGIVGQTASSWCHLANSVTQKYPPQAISKPFGPQPGQIPRGTGPVTFNITQQESYSNPFTFKGLSL
jgi:hypothetical protein